MNKFGRFVAALFLMAIFANRCLATTWDEPWHREVVSKATSFGLYEVEKSDSESVTLRRLKHIAGDETSPVIQVKSFYALRLSSVSGEGPVLRLPTGTKAYFHLKPEDGAWAIATPTAGFAPLRQDGKVYATYRISMHQALLDPGMYEDTQRCIFQVLHGSSGCDPQISTMIKNELAKPVGGIVAADKPEMREIFFGQHAALETAALISYPLNAGTLERFLDKKDVHVQMSALRALAVSGSADTAERLMRFVEDDKRELAARILAVKLLEQIGVGKMRPRLLAYSTKASEEESGLGINLMDPRIGTNFPSTLKAALEQAGASR